MEHWIEVNLFAAEKDQDRVILDFLIPYVERAKRKGALVSFHYFREPEIRFRVRLTSRRAKLAETKAVGAMAATLQRRGLVSKWHFGNHGEPGKEYVGEEDRYGKRGWKVAQDYFSGGAVTAVRLLNLKRSGKLENPLWARGLGNPWEGGRGNPWKEREEDPLVYHWSRAVHLFTNQLGFNIDDEARLCGRQAERYAKISRDFGVKW